MFLCVGLYVGGALLGFDAYDTVCISAHWVVQRGQGAPSLPSPLPACRAVTAPSQELDTPGCHQHCPGLFFGRFDLSLCYTLLQQTLRCCCSALSSKLSSALQMLTGELRLGTKLASRAFQGSSVTGARQSHPLPDTATAS